MTLTDIDLRTDGTEITPTNEKMVGEGCVRVLLKAFLVGALAFYIGWLMGWYFEGHKHELPSVRQEVKNITVVPEPIKPEVKHILKANPEISEAEGSRNLQYYRTGR